MISRSVGAFSSTRDGGLRTQIRIPVAVARDIRQVMPVAGSFVGMTDAFQGMAVEVSVKA